MNTSQILAVAFAMFATAIAVPVEDAYAAKEAAATAPHEEYLICNNC